MHLSQHLSVNDATSSFALARSCIMHVGAGVFFPYLLAQIIRAPSNVLSEQSRRIYGRHFLFPRAWYAERRNKETCLHLRNEALKLRRWRRLRHVIQIS